MVVESYDIEPNHTRVFQILTGALIFFYVNFIYQKRWLENAAKIKYK